MKEGTNAYIKVEWKYGSLPMVVRDGTMKIELVVLSVLSQTFKMLKMIKRKNFLY